MGRVSLSSRWVVVLVFASVIPLLAWSLTPQSLAHVISLRFPSVDWVDRNTLAEWMAEGEESAPLLLDVRTPEEFAVSHLRGAVRVDPDRSDLEFLRVPKKSVVVVYCSVGYRSAAFAEALEEAGVERVYNLRGGIFAWANEGRPLVRNGAPANAVHPYDAIWGRLLRKELRWPQFE
jgi:rhodanese-related sulfurtransferase